MGKLLVPLTMIAAMLGFAVAALTVAFVPDHGGWWRAAVSLAVLGGVTPMIYAVNIRVVPMFSRRAWRSLAFLRAQVAILLAAAWITYAGRLMPSKALIIAGAALALVSGLLFMYNLMGLFRQPAAGVAAPVRHSEQLHVDKLAVQFTRWAGMYLLTGLVVGAVTSIWEPNAGRWDLVWAHAMLLGFMLSMAAGVSYHLLSRWTGHPWRSILSIRVHLLTVLIGFPVMLLALATGLDRLFMIAGPLQAAAVALFLWNIAPMAVRMPGFSRSALLIAIALLLTGIGLGAWFATDPAVGARLRMAHAEVNLFGWTGLLISGIGYYFVPRLAGRPLRWAQLAPVQLMVLGGGVLAGAIVLACRGYGHPAPWALYGAQAMVAAGFALFGVITGGTFFSAKPVAAATIHIARRPVSSSLPMRPSR